MSDNEKNVRREKVDAADGKNTEETFLPGQIPVDQAAAEPITGPAGEERQPDPVSAEKAVNPELEPVKDRKPRT